MTDKSLRDEVADREFAAGYFDGRDRSAPAPGQNRSHCYRHSFAVGRAELAGEPFPASLSRERAERAIRLDLIRDATAPDTEDR